MLSKLKFNGYVVEKIRYECKKNENQSNEISPKIKSTTNDINDREFETKLEFYIDDESSVPFEVDVIIVGKFEADEDVSTEDYQSFKKQNSVAILFPFLRSIVANLTMNANVQALMLPIINLTNEK